MFRLPGLFSVLDPQLGPVQTRALIRVGVVLRWVAIAFAGLAGYVSPTVPQFLTPQILAAVVYNGLVMGGERQASDGALPAWALGTTAVDQVFCLSFITFYSVPPGSHQIAAYVPAMIEAVGFFGAGGAALSTSCFLAGVLVIQAAFGVFGRPVFDPTSTFGAVMIVILIGACLAGARHALMPASAKSSVPAAAADPAAPAGLELSAREREVLSLLALGHSNATIAAELGLSDRSVKACMERLLGRLKARNRAEAVAAAARMQLL